MKRAWILCIISIFLWGCVSLKGKDEFFWQPVKPIKPRSGCKSTYKVNGRTYCVRDVPPGYVEYGIASWYGPGFHGKRTANGEIYNMYKLTAAHKTLPLNTYVKVINLENGKSVIVKVNDRGPFVEGRIIDLSYAAAKRLGMLKRGTAKVKLVVFGKKVNNEYKFVNLGKGTFYVQVGAFKNKLNAFRYKKKILSEYGIQTEVIKLNGYYRVLAGPVSSYKKAKQFKLRLKRMGLSGSFIIRQ